MKVEVEFAVSLVKKIIEIYKRWKSSLSKKQLEYFCRILAKNLYERYQNHWFPEMPERGSGYRCIRNDHKMDPIIIKTGLECMLNKEDLDNLLPPEFFLWVDPKTVSYQIGSAGSICDIFGSSYLQKQQSIVRLKNQKPVNCTVETNNPVTAAQPAVYFTPVSVPRPPIMYPLNYNWNMPSFINQMQNRWGNCVIPMMNPYNANCQGLYYPFHQ